MTSLSRSFVIMTSGIFLTSRLKFVLNSPWFWVVKAHDNVSHLHPPPDVNGPRGLRYPPEEEEREAKCLNGALQVHFRTGATRTTRSPRANMSQHDGNNMPDDSAFHLPALIETSGVFFGWHLHTFWCCVYHQHTGWTPVEIHLRLLSYSVSFFFADLIVCWKLDGHFSAILFVITISGCLADTTSSFLYFYLTSDDTGTRTSITSPTKNTSKSTYTILTIAIVSDRWSSELRSLSTRF